ncbi:CocE/NonD family hydrolase [Streptomonospora wellingtoniae]|uniref:CocE/NonD family hydrolase n=1 Tax=Streptomonospora wellingtoniae TaxID=3075544 RepID=A0ABU2KWU4_9ACTN|nr:CocE/NonD family hydrolase [Streptomonospora sp. DSM 45055]MDT0303723.1 CocE/NonD family hydrolase [Streptomonospora sp. DSM 45055]
MPRSDRDAGWKAGLPPVRCSRVLAHRGLAVPLPGGGRLLADRYHPADDERAPLVLMRTPYGRRSGAWTARLIAKRGYQVLIVSTAGTGGSSGRFRGWLLDPGEPGAIMDWLRTRSWFPGAMATWGASFLGYTQWQMGTESVDEWRAALIQDAPPEVYTTFLYRGGVLALGDWLRWAQQMSTLGRADGDPSLLRGVAALIPALLRGRRAYARLPVSDADRVLAGRRIDFFQEWLAHRCPDELWQAMDHTANAERLPPVVHLAGGWYDPFLPGVLDGYAALRSGESGARRSVRLLIGPWTHGWSLFTRAYMSEAFAVLEHALRGGGEPAGGVGVWVGGAEHWRDLDAWPPPDRAPTPLYLHPGGRLGRQRPEAGAPTPLRYDPADPTPSVGGPVLFGGGAKDSRPLLGRADVAAFTGPELQEAVEAAGPVAAQVYVASALEHCDVFVRLCDVDPRGRWHHVCDGIVRLEPGGPGRDGAEEESDTGSAGGAWRVYRARVRLWPAAHLFARGHRVGVLVTGGAHPRYERNLGTGDQSGTAMRANDLRILHEGAHPSALELPLRAP